jgi:hypothetical protein
MLPSWHNRGMRHALAACTLAALLCACGGGTVVIGGDGFFLNLVAFSNGSTIRPAPGQPLSAVIRPGESIEFDAGTPANWSVSVNGGTAAGAGSTFVVGGLTITTTVQASGRLAIATSLAQGALVQPVTLTLTSVAQADPRQAATITLQIR